MKVPCCCHFHDTPHSERKTTTTTTTKQKNDEKLYILLSVKWKICLTLGFIGTIQYVIYIKIYIYLHNKRVKTLCFSNTTALFLHQEIQKCEFLSEKNCDLRRYYPLRVIFVCLWVYHKVFSQQMNLRRCCSLSSKSSSS